MRPLRSRGAPPRNARERDASARHGWRVNAVDIATTAVEQVGARAIGLDDRVVTQRRELAQLPEREVRPDLGTSTSTRLRTAAAHVLRTAAQALREDGRLLVVDHGPITPSSWNQDPNTHFPNPIKTYTELVVGISRTAVRSAARYCSPWVSGIQPRPSRV
jgi:hypothetical protein